jgi:hypothetical protein
LRFFPKEKSDFSQRNFACGVYGWRYRRWGAAVLGWFDLMELKERSDGTAGSSGFAGAGCVF